MKPVFSFVAPLAVIALGAPALARAGAATDGSTGPVQTLSGRFTVPQTLGTLRGGNLFHSFARFSIAPGESATFTTTDAGIRHVVSRVTGGEASLLQGPLALQAAAGSRPDFWFVNPGGITVGAGASFDVPAGLHLATAQQVRFADGSAWSTTGAAGSSLSVAEPQAFGFLGGAAAAAITLDQAAVTLRGPLTLAAGELALRGSLVDGLGGPIRLAAVAGAAAAVPVDGPLAGLAEAAAAAGGGGALRIERSTVKTTAAAGIAATAASVAIDTSEVTTSHAGTGVGGSVLIAAGGAIAIADSIVGAETVAGGRAGDVVVAARGALAVADSLIVSQTQGPGASGAVAISAGSFDLADLVATARATEVGTRSAAGAGPAGAVAVAVDGRLAITGPAVIGSRTAGAGPAGSVRVSAAQLDIDGQGSTAFAGIASQASTGSSGAAGAVTVTTQQGLRLARGGQVSSRTLASGDAGAVRVDAASIEIDGSDTGLNVRTGISSDTSPGSSGRAGAVAIAVAGRLSINEAGSVSSSTFGSGNAGEVSVRAGRIDIIGTAAGGRAVGIVSQAQPGSSGRAGSVQVAVADDLRLRRGGSVTSATFSTGDAGTVRITAGSIDIDGSDTSTGVGTGVYSSAERASRGNAGTVVIEAAGRVRVAAAGVISSGTFGSGNAGGVVVQAREVEIVGIAAGGRGTGILSQAESGSTGRAGSVRVQTSAGLTVLRGGSVSSGTFGTGDAGSVNVVAGSIEIDGSSTEAGVGTGISSNAERGSRGNGGTVAVESSGRVRIVEAGSIGSATFGAGNGGGVAVQAREIEIVGVASGTRGTGISTQANADSTGRAGSVAVSATAGLSLRRGGSVSSGTFGAGDAGSVRVTAGSIDIDGTGGTTGTGLFSNAGRGSSGNAGTVAVDSAGLIRLLAAGSIASDTFGAGNGGGVTVKARDIEIAGTGLPLVATGIRSQASPGSIGRAGSVQVEASATLAIRRGGSVSSSTFAAGDAGGVRIRAGSVEIDGSGADGSIGTGVFSAAERGSSGSAGTVTLESGGLVRIVEGGTISSGTFGSGHGGGVVVQAREIEIVGVAAGNRATSIASQANAGSTGRAGSVRVDATAGLTVRRGGSVSSSTFAEGNAGDVRVSAGSIEIDGGNATVGTGLFSNAIAGSRGNAGTVTVESGGLVRIVDSGVIASSTFSAGNAGSVSVQASDIVIAGNDSTTRATGIVSQAEPGSTGNAGSVRVGTTQRLSLLRAGFVSSSTSAAGVAGDVRIDAGTMDIDGSGVGSGRTGAFSQANAGSSGQTGSVVVRVDGLLSMRNGATLSIANQAQVADGARLLVPTSLAVDAGAVLLDGSSLSATATGNTFASRIALVSRGDIRLRGSAIRTSAAQGDGGDLRVQAAGTLSLRDASITTSVFGTRGNGGDIAIQAPALVLRSGFVQANTAAARAQGGDVRIDAPLLVPDGSNVFIGGNRVERVTTGVAGFNVIQAAAPEGLSGTLDVTLPQLSLSGALAGLSTARIDFGLLGRDACYAGEDSSFTRPGRGALPPQPGQPVRVTP